MKENLLIRAKARWLSDWDLQEEIARIEAALGRFDCQRPTRWQNRLRIMQAELRRRGAAEQKQPQNQAAGRHNTENL